MKKLKVKGLYLILFLALFVFTFGIREVYAQNQNANINNSTNNKTLYFFYGQECPHCIAAEPFIENLSHKYNLTFIRYETWHNESNKKILEGFLVNYNIPKNSWGVPAFFMDSQHIIGFDSVETTGKSLEEMIDKCLNNDCEQPSKIRFSLFGKSFEIEKDGSLLWLGLILGFADGFNPCTFAILIFLMSYILTVSSSRKKVLRLGLIFSLVIFIVYVLIMLGLINIISFVSFKEIGKLIIGVILLVLALINIKDFFFKGVGPSLEIPKFAQPILEKYIKKLTIISIIILAVILSIVEVGCTLGLPLAYVTVMAGEGIVGISSFFYILWYNLFYIMPLLAVIFLVYFFVLEAEKAEEYRQKLRKYMKLIGGLIMLVLALAFLLNWL